MEELESQIKKITQEIKNLEVKKAILELQYLKILYNQNNNNNVNKLQKETVGIN